MDTLTAWILRAIMVMATAYLIPGFWVTSFWGALVLVLVLGLLDKILKPILLIFTLPINVLTLGLFTIVINAIVLQLAIRLVPGVGSESFATTLIASVVMGIMSVLAGSVVK